MSQFISTLSVADYDAAIIQEAADGGATYAEDSPRPYTQTQGATMTAGGQSGQLAANFAAPPKKQNPYGKKPKSKIKKFFALVALIAALSVTGALALNHFLFTADGDDTQLASSDEGNGILEPTVAEPDPDPTPEATPTSEADPTTDPTPDPTPEATPEATPAPTPAPTPTPTPTPTPEPTPARPKAGDIMEFGGYEWRLLKVQDDRVLLLSERILEHRLYHGAGGYITWADCELRAYLNGEFLESFSESDRARIIETRNTNENNQWYYEQNAGGTRAPVGGADTDDRIFLLSLEEAVRYFGDSGLLANRPAAAHIYLIDDQYNKERFARCLDSCPYNSYHENGVYGNGFRWWLRSPGEESSRAASIDVDGRIKLVGDGVANPSFDKTGVGYQRGVRPALWLSLE